MKKVVGIFVSKNRAVAHNGEKYLVCENNLLDFLVKCKSFINCFYNLSYNVACLLSWLDISEDKLIKLKEGQNVWVGEYRLSYITNKYFAIKKGEGWDSPYAQFYDISQYIPWKLEDNNTVEYDIGKAKESQDTGHQVYNALVKLGLDPDKGMTSPIRVYEKDKLRKMDLPTLADIPEEASQYAYECCKAGWFEVYKKGSFQTWDYDLSSAYGSGIANLMDIRLGKFWKSEKYEPSADYGYIRGEITVNSEFSPFAFSVDNSEDVELYSLIGTWDYILRKSRETGQWENIPYIISKKQYDGLYKWGIGTFKIYDAWWWKAQEKKYPYRDAVNWLYEQKEKGVGLEREIPKRQIVGLFGLQLQTMRDGFGDYFNPIYGCEIEMNTRIEVFDACMSNNVTPLSIALDGILVDKPMNLRMDDGMGSWKLSHEGKAIVVSTVAVAVEGKESEQDFAVGYEGLLEQIKEQPQERVYSKEKISHISLEKAIKDKKLGTIGEVEKISRSIDVAYETKRLYFNRPMTGQELLDNKYESSALDISFMAIDK